MALASEYTGEDDGPLVVLEDLSIEACGEQARSLLYFLTGTKEEQDYMESDGREKWEDVVRVVADICLRAIECHWSTLAGKCFETYHGGRTLDNEPLPMKLIWEAIARHLVNVVTATEDDVRRDLYFQFEPWKKWLVEKLQKAKA